MSAIATSAPARPSVSASARPSPREPPVTSATRPVRSISSDTERSYAPLYSAHDVEMIEIGTTVALREIWRGRVWKARPAIAVRDEPELAALWTPDGSPMRIADTGSGVPTHEWELVPSRAEWGELRLHEPGSSLVHIALWRDGAFDGWKIDVVRPLRRFVVGFEYLDLELDVCVTVDGNAHRDTPGRDLPPLRRSPARQGLCPSTSA